MSKSLVLSLEDYLILQKGFDTKSKIVGVNHNLYKYPACYSPELVNSLIDIFTKKNDHILDPFCGGGTTGICALNRQRNSTINDLNEFAYYVSSVKTNKYSEAQINIFERWFVNIYPYKRYKPKKKSTKGLDERLNNKTNWPIRNFIVDYLHKTTLIKNNKSKELAIILLLRVVKRAFDSKDRKPDIAHVKNITLKYYRELLDNVRAFRDILDNHKESKIKVTNYDFRELRNKAHYKNTKFNAIITSPPYPGVHIRYDRISLNSTKVTDIQYFISDTKPLEGVNSYTFSTRISNLEPKYFRMIYDGFYNLRDIIDYNTLIIQVVGFRDKSMLKKYLNTMELAGYEEYFFKVNGRQRNRLWRKVVNRSFHAASKGDIPASEEVLLIHKKGA